MTKPKHAREAYTIALQCEHLIQQLVDKFIGPCPREAKALAAYTRRMMQSLRRSNDCVGTERGRQHSLQAMVWMVEALIMLNMFYEADAERVLVDAAREMMERVEEALREEGSLPPAIE